MLQRGWTESRGGTGRDADAPGARTASAGPAATATVTGPNPPGMPAPAGFANPSDDPDLAADLRAALAESYDVVALLDLDGRICFVSDEAHGLLGHHPDALLGVDALELLHPDDRDEAAALLASSLSAVGHRSPTRIARLLRPDGSVRETEVFAVDTLDRYGAFTVGLRDLANRRVSDRVMAADDVLFRRLATISSDLMLMLDEQMCVVYVSPTVTSVLGYQIEEAREIPVASLFAPVDRPAVDAAVLAAMDDPGVPQRLELRSLTSTGSVRWVELTIVDLFDDPMVRSLVLHARDVHTRHVAEEELRYRAMHDPLTGLANRYSFVEHLSSGAGAAFGADDDRPHTALIFCDLDGFKQVNDRFGHSAGDEVLRYAGARLRTAVRPGDLVARIGGDEFCVVCRGLGNVHDAMEIAGRIRSAVSEPVSLGVESVRVGVSIGIAWTTDAEIDGDQLLGVADRAMYVAKSGGSNRVEIVAVP